MSLINTIRRLSHALLPVQCASCENTLDGDPVPFFCRSCWETVQPISEPFCPCCGRPFPSPLTLRYSPEHVCGMCRLRRPAYTRAWSLYRYDSPLQEAIRLFKYHKKVALADALGALMQCLSLDLLSVDAVMPVPLYATRLRDREYNQSLLLAERVSRARRLPLSYDNLIRTRDTPPQTELTRAVRLNNVRRAFAVQRPEEVAGKRILVIDDVFTTGATVNECAKTLRRAGATDVYVCTLARTV